MIKSLASTFIELIDFHILSFVWYEQVTTMLRFSHTRKQRLGTPVLPPIRTMRSYKLCSKAASVPYIAILCNDSVRPLINSQAVP